MGLRDSNENQMRGILSKVEEEGATDTCSRSFSGVIMRMMNGRGAEW